MTDIPLGIADWRRVSASEPEILVRNRYFEENPTNQKTQTALLQRPSLVKWKTIGDGPIRQVFSEPGAFIGTLFVVSGDELYRVDPDGTETLIGNVATPTTSLARPSLTATDQFMFLADGSTLYSYENNSQAAGELTATAIVATETVSLGAGHYEFTATDVDAGAPDGSISDPWLVLVGGTVDESFDNLIAAINETGTAGTTYSTDLTANPDAFAQDGPVAASLTAVAIIPGTVGNSITVAAAGVDIAWDNATLTGGGAVVFAQVEVPDDAGVVAVATLASYVIVVIGEGNFIDGKSADGRWYFIRPGRKVIQALDFSTAEKAPDPLFSVRAIGDLLMFPGANSTEFWYPTGNQDEPFLRSQGRLFERGVWEGTDVAVKDQMIVVDRDGAVYSIGGEITRLSDPSIEERIRKAIANQIVNTE